MVNQNCRKKVCEINLLLACSLWLWTGQVINSFKMHIYKIPFLFWIFLQFPFKLTRYIVSSSYWMHKTFLHLLFEDWSCLVKIWLCLYLVFCEFFYFIFHELILLWSKDDWTSCLDDTQFTFISLCLLSLSLNDKCTVREAHLSCKSQTICYSHRSRRETEGRMLLSPESESVRET